jgi:hypothetical protein
MSCHLSSDDNPIHVAALKKTSTDANFEEYLKL